MTLTLLAIDGAHRLETAAAESYGRMLTDGCPAGHVNSAYRSYEEQAALRAAYLAYKAGRGPYAAPANKPGTSKHEVGLAIDVSDPTKAWFKAHGLTYGWHPIASEDWHFEYRRATDGAAWTTLLGEKTLRLGSYGTDVKAWQYLANLAGHALGVTLADLNPDGGFGPLTDAYTRAVQGALGITVDGLVGSGTLTAARAATASPVPIPDPIPEPDPEPEPIPVPIPDPTPEPTPAPRFSLAAFWAWLTRLITGN